MIDKHKYTSGLSMAERWAQRLSYAWVSTDGWGAETISEAIIVIIQGPGRGENDIDTRLNNLGPQVKI